MTIDPIEFGRLIATLEALRGEVRELKDRSIWRLDNLEGRIEALERKDAAQTVVVTTNAEKSNDWGKWVERALLFLVAAATGILFGVK